MGQGEDQPQQILNDVVAVQLQSVSTPGLSYPLDRTQVFKSFNPANPIGFTPRAYAVGYNLPENVLSYTFSIQQSLPTRAVLTAAYVGSQGRNSFQRTITNRITSVGTNPTNGSAIITREFGDKYGEVDVKTSFGNNHYDSLQVALNRQSTKALSLGLTYTWSHSIGTSGGSNEATTSQNNYEFGGERGDNSGDIRHVFNVASVYEVPFGRGHGVNFGGSRLADAFLGGWQLSGNYSYRSGVPVNVTVQRNDVLYLNPTTGIYTTSPVIVGGSLSQSRYQYSRRRRFTRPAAAGPGAWSQSLFGFIERVLVESGGFRIAQARDLRQCGSGFPKRTKFRSIELVHFQEVVHY